MKEEEAKDRNTIRGEKTEQKKQRVRQMKTEKKEEREDN
jgi:hypothetical protein